MTAFVAAIFLVLATGLPIFIVLSHLLVPIGPVWQHLASTVLSGYVLHSILLVIGVTGCAMAIAIPAAWLVAIYDFPGARWLRWGLLAPTAVPAYIAAYAYTDFLQFAGPLQQALRDATGWRHGDYWFPQIRSLGGAIIVMTLVFYPYIYLFARTAFEEQGHRLLIVARTLGHGPFTAFWRIALPAIRPALAAGAALVAMETLADFATVDFFAIPTFTTGIYRTWFNLGQPLAAARLSGYLVIFALILLIIERSSRQHQRFSLRPGSEKQQQSIRLSQSQGWAACIACLIPIIGGFIIPVLLLVELAFQTPFAGILQDLPVLIGDTLKLAGLAATLTTMVALLATGLISRLHPIRSLLVRLSGLGYAVPGTVLAVGILIPAGYLDQQFGVGTLSGSIFLLLFAYVVRFVSVAHEGLEAGMQRLSPSLFQAAKMLGAGLGRRWFLIKLPLLAPTIITTILLVALDTIKELPATLILRPFNWETLAVRVYRYAGDERLREAAPAALCMIGLGFLSVLIITKAAGSKN